jgi:6-phosphogluconate dehydrogenase
MEIGLIGLGRMGLGIASRLRIAGARVVGFDLDERARDEARSAGVEVVGSSEEVARRLLPSRTVWMMLPAGEAVDSAIGELCSTLEEGDTIVDGGNSHYRDSIRRGKSLHERGVHFVDVGTSGGIQGAEHGFCLMVGGDPERVEGLRPALEALAPAADRGWGRVGSLGAGHYAKMVHNGIEYGLMAAYAEGFAVLAAREGLDLDAGYVADVWRHGSVIRSALLDLAARELASPEDLSHVAAWVPDTGGGRWAVEEAIALDVPAPVITAALLQRLASRSNGFAERLLARLRQRFGGHPTRGLEEDD